MLEAKLFLPPPKISSQKHPAQDRVILIHKEQIRISRLYLERLSLSSRSIVCFSPIFTATYIAYCVKLESYSVCIPVFSLVYKINQQLPSINGLTTTR